jgi:hypothetical protein
LLALFAVIDMQHSQQADLAITKEMEYGLREHDKHSRWITENTGVALLFAFLYDTPSCRIAVSTTLSSILVIPLAYTTCSES